MKLRKVNEMIITDEKVTAQVALDVLFDLGAKIVNVLHENGQSEILFEYNNQKATLYFFEKKKTLQIAHSDVILKSLHRINTIDDLVRILTDLLKRIF